MIRTARFAGPIDISVELQPKELRLLEMMDGESLLIGYGGARGGAKSHAVRAMAVLRRLKYPGTCACIFRRTYDQLWQQHVMPLMSEWPDLFKRYWSAENKALMLPGNSPVLFRYADTLKDVLEFKGKEYGDLFIDEATDMHEEELNILYTCCRSPVRGFRPRKVLTFNPGGVGHAYAKRVFIDRDLTAEERVQNPAFIQAYAWDNVIWVRDALAQDGVQVRQWYDWPRERQIEYLTTRSDYGKQLNALPQHLRKPWLYGDWDTFMGQVFAEFSRDVHVVKPFKIPAHWRRWMSNDPGFADPSVWYWHAADELGTVYTYRETTFQRTAPSEQAKRCVELMTHKDANDKPHQERIDFTVTGQDAFVRHPEVGKSIGDYYESGGLRGIIRPDHGAGCRARMASVCHEYLRRFPGMDGRETAKVLIFETCRELIRTLPSLPADENDPEAVAECSSDHWYQAWGYGLQAWHARRSLVPKEEKYPTGTAGQILNHQAILEPDEPQSVVFSMGGSR